MEGKVLIVPSCHINAKMEQKDVKVEQKESIAHLWKCVWENKKKCQKTMKSSRIALQRKSEQSRLEKHKNIYMRSNNLTNDWKAIFSNYPRK